MDNSQETTKQVENPTVTLVGKISFIGETKELENFKVRNFFVQVQGQYGSNFPISFFKDNCNILDNYKKDDLVEVVCNSKAIQTKKSTPEIPDAFISYGAWKIKKIDETT